MKPANFRQYEAGERSKPRTYLDNSIGISQFGALNDPEGGCRLRKEMLPQMFSRPGFLLMKILAGR
jgi:hypothetical protein